MSRTRLRTLIALPGWLVVFAVGCWGFLDVLSNVDWILGIGSNPRVRHLWDLALTPTGLVVLLLAGFAWLTFCAFLPAEPGAVQGVDKELPSPPPPVDNDIPKLEAPTTATSGRALPNIVLLDAGVQRVGFVERGMVLSDSRQDLEAACATFRNEMVADREVGYALFVKAHLTVRRRTSEVLNVDAGFWIAEDFQTTKFSPADTRTLVIALKQDEDDRLAFLDDRRESVDRFEGPLVKEFEGKTALVTVKLVDRGSGLAQEFGFRVTAGSKFGIKPIQSETSLETG